MVGILILTHGDLARELLAAARKIAGELDNFEALPLSWTDGIEKARERVGLAIQRLDRGRGVLILTDIFGGTPTNIAMIFRQPGRVEVISGVNLPMVVRLGCRMSDGMLLGEMASWIRDKGKKSICCGNELRSRGPDPQPVKCEDLPDG